MYKTISSASISAIIVSYNGMDTIEKTINCLRGKVGCIIVVDNFSTDASQSILDKIDDIFLIRNESNLGVAAALNRGFKISDEKGFDWVLTMDQDSIVTDDMINTMVEIYSNLEEKEKNQVVSLAPKVILKNAKLPNKKTRIPYIEKEAVITSGNLVKISAIKKVGGYTECLFIDSVDFDFCLRLKKAGYKILQCQNAILLHSLGKTIVKNIFGIKLSINTHSSLRKYFISRNHIYINRHFFLSNPIFCIKKNISFFAFCFQSMFLEQNRIQNIKSIFMGIIDGLKGKYNNISLLSKIN